MNKLFLIMALVLCLVTPSAHATESWQGIRNDEGMLFYSNMGFVKEEGEYSGLQIAIIPYNPQYGHFKYKVLWRSGEGYLDTPLLLDASVQGNVLTINIPEKMSGAEGKWTLIVDGNHLYIEDPLENHYDLQKVDFKMK